MAYFKQSGSRLALIALLTATPALVLAQTATTEGETTEEPAEAPADTMTNETPAVDPNLEQTEMAETEEMPKPVEGQIIMQSENTILANDLIGINVYSPDGESIGEVDNLIVNLDGTVDGVVIGVGGFLGIGEKDVAVEMGSLSTAADENGNVRLTSSATKTDLEAADAFVTAADQKAAKRALENAPAVDPNAAANPAIDGTAPADGTQPADN